MKFESLLARRYLIAQRRHAVLTVCAISIAVAVIVLICTCFSTITGIIRDAALDQQPYHVLVYSVTEAQGKQISQLNHIGSCTLTENPDGKTYSAAILFDSNIGNLNDYMQNMERAWKIRSEYAVNDDLVMFDAITFEGGYKRAVMFTLFFIFVIFFVLALRMMIDTAFEVSSKERERQFGVLQSIGATPKQIVRIMTHEGLLLSAAGIPIGTVLGIGLSVLVYHGVLATGVAETFFDHEKMQQLVHLHVSPMMLLAAAVIGFFWVFFSAYGTGMRVVKKPPIQVITGRSKSVKRVKKHSLLSLLFGWTGKLASRNARREPKRFAMTVFALTVSLTLFASVSTVFGSLQDFVQVTFVGRDSFGKTEWDFSVPVRMNPNAFHSDKNEDPRSHTATFQRSPESPTAYAEGVAELEQCGYFKDLDYSITLAGKTDDTDNVKYVYIYYVNEYSYDTMFDGKMPVPFGELANSGKAVLVGRKQPLSEIPVESDTLTLTVRTRQTADLTQAEYQALTKDLTEQERKNREKYPQEEKQYDENGEEIAPFYWQFGQKEICYDIAGQYVMPDEPDQYGNLDGGVYLFLAEPRYRDTDWKQYGDVSFGITVNCNLADGAEYMKAVQYLQTSPHLIYDDVMDIYRYRQRTRTALAAVSVGLNFLTALIAMIAAVNMINIVSTGILNRKREFAALQCSGMTRGQMYRLTVVECLQFTLWAAIAASLLCCLLIYATKQFMIGMTLSSADTPPPVAYSVPVLKVWLASAAAFLVTLLASLLPLRRMQEEPLAEQIRATE